MQKAAETADFQVVLSRQNSTLDQGKKTDSANNVDIEKIVQMEVDAAVGQMHVSMQRDMAKLRAKYRTKLHQERQKNRTVKK